MSYSSQAKLARDSALLDRVCACAASEHVKNPSSWAYENQWRLSATPGWSAAYSAALAAEIHNPGDREDVITDAMILSSVQNLLATNTNE